MQLSCATFLFPGIYQQFFKGFPEIDLTDDATRSESISGNLVNKLLKRSGNSEKNYGFWLILPESPVRRSFFYRLGIQYPGGGVDCIPTAYLFFQACR